MDGKFFVLSSIVTFTIFTFSSKYVSFSCKIESHRKKRVARSKRTENDIRRYAAVDKLEDLLQRKGMYTLVHLTDEAMDVPSAEVVTCRRFRTRYRGLFLSSIGFKFPVMRYTYETPGSASNWVALFRIPRNLDDDDSNAVQCKTTAAANAPIFLSRRETADQIESIRLATGNTHFNKSMSISLLSSILRDGTTPSFCSTKSQQLLVKDITDRVLCRDDVAIGEECDLIEDMRVLNCRGNLAGTGFKVFWNAAARILETDAGAGAHRRRHASSDEHTTVNVSYAPAVVSVSQLIQKTTTLLVDVDKKVEGVDFRVPSLSWAYLQLSPTHENRKTAERYTGELPFKRVLQSRTSRDTSHPHGHWTATMKKLWRYKASFMVRLLNMSRKEGDYMNSDDDDDHNTVLDPLHALLVVGQDDKTGIPVGRTLPIASTSRQRARGIVPEGTNVVAADHDFSCEKLTPSVTLRMNLTETPGESLFSGGKDGNGKIYVSLHDATMDHSTGFKHVANLYRIMRDEAEKATQGLFGGEAKPTPYYVLVECDGGPDHNLRHVGNQVSLFSLFLVGNMDKLVATRGCPGLSYLNSAERAMAILAIGVSSCALSIDPRTEEWLMLEVLHGAMSMKAVRNAVIEYDTAVPQAIAVLERREQNRNQSNKQEMTLQDESQSLGDLATLNSEQREEASCSQDESQSLGDVDISNSNQTDTSSSQDKSQSLSDTATSKSKPLRVSKFFPFLGWFSGTVKSFSEEVGGGKSYTILFEDGEYEEWSEEEWAQHKEEETITVGDVGFRFIRKFGRAGNFNGEVRQICSNGKRECVFNDGEVHKYTLQKIVAYAKSQELPPPESEESSDEEFLCDIEDEEDKEDDDKEHSRSLVSKEATAKSHSECTDKVADEVNEGVLLGKYLKNLVSIPTGRTLKEWIVELKERKTARECFDGALDYPLKIVEERFKSLNIDGRQVEVKPYPKEAEVKVLTDALRAFDPSYDPEKRSKSGLQQMKNIAEFMNSPEHCRISEYTLEYRLCGVAGCVICANIGREPRTPSINVDGYNLREEVLDWMEFPTVNPADNDHYLGPQATRAYLKANNVPFEKLKGGLPKAKEDNEEMKAIAFAAEEDKKFKFVATKVRAIVKCDDCGAPRCVYSNNGVGRKGGPTSAQKEHLEQWIEHGYICGNKVPIETFYIRQKIRCGAYIESQYYNPSKNAVAGGRIITEHACAICYTLEDAVSVEEIKKKRTLGGKNPLPLCRYCFDSRLKVPTTAGSSNKRQKKQQDDTEKKRQLESAVASGRRKGRRLK